MDAKVWSTYGAERPQPVATGSYGGASDDRSTVVAFSRKRRSRDAGCSSPWRSSTLRVCSHTRQRRMERLWSLAVATSGNRRQIGRGRKRLRQPKAVAVGCDPLPPGPHGKEGVDGSSPSEGFSKGQQMAFLLPRRRTYVARSPLNLSPRSVPNIAVLLQSWLEQRRLTTSSTSMKGRCLVTPPGR